jgi:hypothetical protein
VFGLSWYKRAEIPIAITIICALIQIIPYFFTLGPDVESFMDNAVNWEMVVATGALFVGAISIILVHAPRVVKMRQYWEYSLILLILMFVMMIVGLPIWEWGLGMNNDIFNFLTNNVLTPLDSSLYAMLAFFIASAAYRAFKARSLEAALLLIAGSILVFRNAPLGTFLVPQVASLGDWLFNVPNMAVQRSIIIGAALGAIVLGIRTLTGYERGYLRGGT